MTEIRAKLLLASINTVTNDILYTWELTFPRQILAEVNTHRMASKNTSSSRAIRMRVFREKVWHDPFYPYELGLNIPGMQAGDKIEGWRETAAYAVISAMRIPALLGHWCLEKLKVHKQVSNRYLEPWMWTVQCFSMTEVDNLLLLRAHKDAEPHFQLLAYQMKEQVAYVRATRNNPRSALMEAALGIERIQYLQPGDWHTPYITPKEEFPKDPADELTTQQLIDLSVARCANVSFTQPGERKVIDNEAASRIIYNLFGGPIKHLSPTEHTAKASGVSEMYGNFRGFIQYRKTIPGESGCART